MSEVRLVRPNYFYRESFLRGCRLLEQVDPDYPECKIHDRNFLAHIDDLNSRYITKTPGFVPSTELWLVDGKEWLGRASVRHTLTPALVEYGGNIGYMINPAHRRKGYGYKILECALKEARAVVDTQKVLFTICDQNHGTRKIIEAHGGVMSDEIPRVDGGTTQRYWIEL